MDTEDEELEALKKYRPAAVMIMANDGADPTPEGCCQFIEDFYLPMLEDIASARRSSTSERWIRHQWACA